MNKLTAMLLVLVFCASCATGGRKISSEEDPNLWLEEIESQPALNWVRARNARTLAALERAPVFKKIEAPIRKITLAKDRIPYGDLMGGYIYNFWQDARSVRGIWRRATASEYARKSPSWETLLDLDRAAREEKENWVWKGAHCLPPEYQRCLLTLSRGGKDASVVREFDVPTKSFVRGGFEVPEAKSDVTWIDKDTIFVGTDFGPGTLTRSGYPRVLKKWKRGQPLAAAEQVFEAKESDVEAGSFAMFRPEGVIYGFERKPSFFESEVWIYDLAASRARKLPVPEDARLYESFRGSLLFVLRHEWRAPRGVFPAGSLVSVPVADPGSASLLYAPGRRATVRGVAAGKDALFVDVLENVMGKVLALRDGKWIELPLPGDGNAHLASRNAYEDRLYAGYESFLVPPTLYELQTPSAAPRAIKRLPARFDATGLKAEQLEAVSADGTRIPYFLVHRVAMKRDNANPTLLYAYGGFEYSMTPSYLGGTGKVWLEKGGVYALANIRGGGEFGPAWHEAALKRNRQKAFDDFEAVAENLIARRITRPEKLGIMGGSNGGLLMGAVTMQRPELFGAVVCQVPLLDMMRFHKLLAGDSWVAEYGNPDDPGDREAILKYSPYQNVSPARRYPPVFFVTSTKDDRVHPGHARKMVARMEATGHDVFYFENIEGGHGAAANLEQRIRRVSLEFSYLSQRLGVIQ